MNLPKRKHPRLNDYDYSLPGYYYATIQTANPSICLSTVGRGLAPAAAGVMLTPMGQIIESQLLNLENRYAHVKIERYIIMPTHLHVIIRLLETAGASPRPTLMDILGAFKSLSTRICNQLDGTPGRKLFQTSFYEEVLRNEYAYLEACRYIDENPIKWLELHQG